MDAINRERIALRQSALKPLGISSTMSRVLSAQVQMTGLEAEILALPALAGGQAVMQNPSTGAQKFVFGISAFGGSDEF